MFAGDQVVVTFSGSPTDLAQLFREAMRADAGDIAKTPFDPNTPPPGWRAAADFARAANPGNPNVFERK